MAQGYVRTGDLPQVIPLFPIDGALLLPRGQLPLNVFEPRYLNMIDDVMAGDRIIGIIQTFGGSRARPRLAPVGCSGRVTSYAETSDGRYLITLTGVVRFRTGDELPSRAPYRQVRADYQPYEADLTPPDDPEGVARDDLLDALRAYLTRRSLDVDWETAREAPEEALVNSLAMALPFEPAAKQALLEAQDLEARSATLTTLLAIGAAVDDDEPPPSVQ
jgi:Lon protease-like protein